MSLRDAPCGEYVSEYADGQWCNRCGWPKGDHPRVPSTGEGEGT